MIKNKLSVLFFFIFVCTILVKAQSPTLAWAKSMGGAGHDYSSYVTTDAAGNVYTTGDFGGTVDFDPNAGTFNLTARGGVWPDVFICKLDASGNFLWAKNIGGITTDAGLSLAVDADENVYATGYFQDTADFDPGAGIFNLISGNGSSDLYVLKLDSMGNFIWAKSIGALSDDNGFSITVDAVGDLFMTGFFEGTVDFDPGSGTANLISGIFADAFILKLDSAGNFDWAKNLSGLAIENGRSIAVDEIGNVYTMGVFQNTTDFDPGPGVYNLVAAGVYDIYISKLDPFGNFIWAKAVGGADYDHGHAMKLDPSGNIYFTGTFQGTSDFDPDAGVTNLTATSNSQDIFICKLDSTGSLQWARSMGSVNSDQGTGITVDQNGSAYCIGYFNGTVDFDPGPAVANLVSVNDDAYICKLDAFGNYEWAETITGSFAQIGESIAIDVLGNIYTTGEFEDIADFDPTAGVYNLSANGLSHFDIYIQKLSNTTTGTRELAGVEYIYVYPNPASEAINITGINSIVGAKVRVYNAYMQLVIVPEDISENRFTLDLKSVVSGIYYITISTDKEMYSSKVVVNNN